MYTYKLNMNKLNLSVNLKHETNPVFGARAAITNEKPDETNNTEESQVLV